MSLLAPWGVRRKSHLLTSFGLRAGELVALFEDDGMDDIKRDRLLVSPAVSVIQNAPKSWI